MHVASRHKYCCAIETNLPKVGTVFLGPSYYQEIVEARDEWLKAFMYLPRFSGREGAEVQVNATLYVDVEFPTENSYRMGADWIYSNYIQRWL